MRNNDNIITVDLKSYSNSDEEVELFSRGVYSQTNFIVDIENITSSATVEVFYVQDGLGLSFIKEVANNVLLLSWLNTVFSGVFEFTIESITVKTSRIFGLSLDESYVLTKLNY